jgi:hypothetical protein
MRILSIDVGIKNLAICILETTNNNSGFIIRFWDVINLFEDQLKICQSNIVTKSKKKTEVKTCNKEAKFHKNGCFYCKSHASKTDYKLPTSDLNKYKRMKLDELINLAQEYNISHISPPNKKNLLNAIEGYIKNDVFEHVSNLKCNEFSLIDIGIAIKEKLEKLNTIVIYDIDTILIENQISPIANRMNCIQGMLSQYFIMKSMTNIQFISAANKLKSFIGNQKTTYSERKKIGVEETKKLLLTMDGDNNSRDKITDMFNKHKKKDDLADCFLQAIWYKGTPQIDVD